MGFVLKCFIEESDVAGQCGGDGGCGGGDMGTGLVWIRGHKKDVAKRNRPYHEGSGCGLEDEKKTER